MHIPPWLRFSNLKECSIGDITEVVARELDGLVRQQTRDTGDHRVWVKEARRLAARLWDLLETTDDVPANNDLRPIPAVRGKFALRPHLRTPRRGGSRFELGLYSNLHSLDGGNFPHDIHYYPDRLPPLRKDFSAQLWISGSSIHGVSTGSATDGSRLLMDTLAVSCCFRHGFTAFFCRGHTVSGNTDSTKPNSTVLSASRRRILVMVLRSRAVGQNYQVHWTGHLGRCPGIRASLRA